MAHQAHARIWGAKTFSFPWTAAAKVVYGECKGWKWVLFILALITVLREGQSSIPYLLPHSDAWTCYLCRGCLPRPIHNSHLHSRHMHHRNDLQSCRFRNLSIRLSVKLVFPWPLPSFYAYPTYSTNCLPHRNDCPPPHRHQPFLHSRRWIWRDTYAKFLGAVGSYSIIYPFKPRRYFPLAVLNFQVIAVFVGPCGSHFKTKPWLQISVA